MTRISVITVCYNSGAHIADALHSIDSQTWRDIEHVVVDGGSSDDTLPIVRAHPHRARRYISERDAGIYDAMNKGIRMAQGDVVGFLNSDDVYASSGALERVATAFDDQIVEACFGDLCYVRQDDLDSIVRYWRSSSFRPGSFVHAWVPPHPTFFVRRSVIERLGAFDLRYKLAADFELMARYLEVHRITVCHIPEVLIKMRLGGATNRSLSNILKQNLEILRALKNLGLRPRLFPFVAHKILSRGKQFLRVSHVQAR